MRFLSQGPDTEGKLELKMTSMIDVVFLLLIFFIVTLRIQKPEAMIEARLEKAAVSKEPGEGPGRGDDFTAIKLILSRLPGGVVMREINTMRFPRDADLYRFLARMKDQSDEGKVLVVCADDVPYGDLVRTIGVIQQAGLPIDFPD